MPSLGFTPRVRSETSPFAVSHLASSVLTGCATWTWRDTTLAQPAVSLCDLSANQQAIKTPHLPASHTFLLHDNLQRTFL